MGALPVQGRIHQEPCVGGGWVGVGEGGGGGVGREEERDMWGGWVGGWRRTRR